MEEKNPLKLINFNFFNEETSKRTQRTHRKPPRVKRTPKNTETSENDQVTWEQQDFKFKSSKLGTKELSGLNSQLKLKPRFKINAYPLYSAISESNQNTLQNIDYKSSFTERELNYIIRSKSKRSFFRIKSPPTNHSSCTAIKPKLKETSSKTEDTELAEWGNCVRRIMSAKNIPDPSQSESGLEKPKLDLTECTKKDSSKPLLKTNQLKRKFSAPPKRQEPQRTPRETTEKVLTKFIRPYSSNVYKSSTQNLKTFETQKGGRPISAYHVRTIPTINLNQDTGTTTAPFSKTLKGSMMQEAPEFGVMFRPNSQKSLLKSRFKEVSVSSLKKRRNEIKHLK